jgi:hypothetical protein
VLIGSLLSSPRLTADCHYSVLIIQLDGFSLMFPFYPELCRNIRSGSVTVAIRFCKMKFWLQHVGLKTLCSVSQDTLLNISGHSAQYLRTLCSISQDTLLNISGHSVQYLRTLCSISQDTLLNISGHSAQYLRTLLNISGHCSISQDTLLNISGHSAQYLKTLCPISQDVSPDHILPLSITGKSFFQRRMVCFR